MSPDRKSLSPNEKFKTSSTSNQKVAQSDTSFIETFDFDVSNEEQQEPDLPLAMESRFNHQNSKVDQQEEVIEILETIIRHFEGKIVANLKQLTKNSDPTTLTKIHQTQNSIINQIKELDTSMSDQKQKSEEMIRMKDKTFIKIGELKYAM